VSKPSARIYVGAKEMPNVRGGMGSASSRLRSASSSIAKRRAATSAASCSAPSGKRPCLVSVDCQSTCRRASRQGRGPLVTIEGPKGKDQHPFRIRSASRRRDAVAPSARPRRQSEPRAARIWSAICRQQRHRRSARLHAHAARSSASATAPR
jgi:hypothetical protein